MQPLRRHRVPERMDAPDLPEREHLHALRGLARLNALSAAARPFWPHVLELARTSPEPLTILDVATGSGDVPLALARRARRANLDVRWSVCDVSPRAVEQAVSRLRAQGFEAEGHVRDVLREPLPGRHDLVLNSLFLHHLDPPDVRRALAAMGAATRKLLLVSDLRRTRRNLAMVHAVPKLVTTSRVVWFDAVASVRAAYTKYELLEMAKTAGLRGAHVSGAWPQRMVLTWTPT